VTQAQTREQLIAEFTRRCTAGDVAALGLRLRDAKRRLGHGRFGTYLRRAGVSSWRASRAMRLARLLASFPELGELSQEQAAALLEAGPRITETLLQEHGAQALRGASGSVIRQAADAAARRRPHVLTRNRLIVRSHRRGSAAAAQIPAQHAHAGGSNT
jgi:hypothetical protein